MTERRFHPKSLDVANFASRTGSLQGEWPLGELKRLAESLYVPGDGLTGVVRWQAHGRLAAAAGGVKQTWLDLEADATVPLQCQRCLMPLIQPLQVRRSVRFVAGETQAAEEDEVCEEDVHALTSKLNLFDLIEDELILELPLVPRHTDCRVPLDVGVESGLADGRREVSAGDTQQPFAGLAALLDSPRPKRGGGRPG